MNMITRECRSFETATMKQAAVQVRREAEMEQRIVEVWQQHDCLYNVSSTTVRTEKSWGKMPVLQQKLEACLRFERRHSVKILMCMSL